MELTKRNIFIALAVVIQLVLLMNALSDPWLLMAWLAFWSGAWHIALIPFYVGLLVSLYKHRWLPALWGLLGSVPMSIMGAFWVIENSF